MVDVNGLMKLSDGRAKIEIVEAIVPALNSQMVEWEINTPLRRAHFLAQACYEPGYFTRLSENLDYNAARIAQVFKKFAARADELAHNPEKLGNAVYAGRFGNGDEASGDGYRFRGRGLFQHTFRANYVELADHLTEDVLSEPDLLAEGAIAVEAALYFFESRGCLPLADADDVAGVTQKINGGTAGLSAREALKNAAIQLGL